MSEISDAIEAVADAAVERACQAIYREFDSYWPSDVERAHIRVALASTIEVDWQAENDRLRQALWDIYGILGFDTDGDKTPDHLVHPPLIDVVVAAAREFRDDYDEAIREVRDGDV